MKKILPIQYHYDISIIFSLRCVVSCVTLIVLDVRVWIMRRRIVQQACIVVFESEGEKS